MTDEQLIALANECLDSGKTMGPALMRDALVAYRRKVEKPLATGLPKLSKRQAETYDAIARLTDHMDVSPTTREIAAEIGNTVSSGKREG